jgi:hypothetical protein
VKKSDLLSVAITSLHKFVEPTEHRTWLLLIQNETPPLGNGAWPPPGTQTTLCMSSFFPRTTVLETAAA